MPPVTKHNVEKVRDIIVCKEYEAVNRDLQCLNPPDKKIYSTNTSIDAFAKNYIFLALVIN